MKHLLLPFAALTLISVPMTPAAAQQVQSVQFGRGASSATVTGSVKGYAYIDYRVVVRAGQRLSVSLARTRGTAYFNVIEPGSSDVAIYVGSTSGDRFDGVTAKSGAYTIRVYQMRNTARRGETAGYRLSVAVTGSAGASVRPPAHRPGDALVAGTPYHATAAIRCRTAMGMAMSTCNGGVVRRPGSASVHLDAPDGGERTILFRGGRAVSSDADSPLRVERSGDTSIVRIGTVEVYEIPDAFIDGG